MSLVAFLTMLPVPAMAVGTWVPLVNQAPPAAFGIGLMLLLSDGTVMCQYNGASNTWYRLTPDQYGSYINGTWTTLASMNYTHGLFSSDVMPNGKVFVAGGEYGTGAARAELYDPVANSWAQINPPTSLLDPTQDGQSGNPELFSDSISVVIADGSVLVAPVSPKLWGGTLIYDAYANIWSEGPLLTNGIPFQDECSWAKLADGSILTIDSSSTTSQRYIPSLNQWIPDATVPADLWYQGEIGAALTLPNGNALFLGANGNTELYQPSASTSPGTWVSGPGILHNEQSDDLPAAMMNNGKILCAVGTNCGNGGCPNPTDFYEYDYTAGSVGSFTQVSRPPAEGFAGAVFMLDLPDGSVLLSQGTYQLYEYVPDGSPLPAGKPWITIISANADGSYHLVGNNLNGISEGATFGDDAQMNSNYPLVRMTNNSTQQVFYARTYNWSSTGIMTGSTPVTTEFTLPASVFAGGGTNYSLVVVANGIASPSVTFYGPIWVDFNYTGTTQIGTFTFPFSTLAQGVSAVPSGGTIYIKPGSSTENPMISKAMSLVAVGGSATVGN